MHESIEVAGLNWSWCDEGWHATFDVAAPSSGDLPIGSSLLIRCQSLDEQEELEALGRLAEQAVSEPSASQIAAVEFFLANQSKVYDQILHELLRFCHARFQEDPMFYDMLQGVDDFTKLRPLLSNFRVCVEPVSARGIAWISLAGDCDWEVEHGTGICIWKDVVLEIGTFDTLLAGPTTEYFMMPALEDSDRENLRIEIVTEIEKAVYAKAALFGQMSASVDDYPESYQLAGALLMGDERSAQEMIARGVRLDDYPEQLGSPIFHAIQSNNADLVERMIKLGASVERVNSQGQTPLQAAEELLRNLQGAQQLQQGVMDDVAAMLQGGTPQPGSLMSMYADLQKEATRLVSEIEGDVPEMPLMPDLLAQQRKHFSEVANQTNRQLPELQRVIDILKKN